MVRAVHLVSLFTVMAVFTGALGQSAPGPGRKLTPEQEEKLKLRDKYGADALALQGEGKFAEARVRVEKGLAIDIVEGLVIKDGPQNRGPQWCVVARRLGRLLADRLSGYRRNDRAIVARTLASS